MREPTTKESLEAAWASWLEDEDELARADAEAIRSRARVTRARQEYEESMLAARQALVSVINSTKELLDQAVKYRNQFRSCSPEHQALLHRASAFAKEVADSATLDAALCQRSRRPDEAELVWYYQILAKTATAVQKSLPSINDCTGSLALEPPTPESLQGEAVLPRFWEILAYLLPPETRRRVYEPARADLLEDYLRSRNCCHGRWSRRTVNGVFFVRTLLLAGECGRVLVANQAVQFWLWAAGAIVAWAIRLLRRPPE